MNAIRLPQEYARHKRLHKACHSSPLAIAISENWKSSDHCFTSDDAYESGKKTGKTVLQDPEYEMFTANVALATKIAEEFNEFFLGLRTSPHIRLRINSLYSFDLAFFVSDAFYLSRFLEAAHDTAHDLCVSQASDTFDVYIYLFPKTKGRDLSELDVYGFPIYYEPKNKKTTLSSCSPQ